MIGRDSDPLIILRHVSSVSFENIDRAEQGCAAIEQNGGTQAAELLLMLFHFLIEMGSLDAELTSGFSHVAFVSCQGGFNIILFELTNSVLKAFGLSGR